MIVVFIVTIQLEFYTVEKWQEKKNKKGQTMYQDEGRAYTPLFSHPDSTLVEENSDKLDIFKKTIVRTPRGTMITPVEIKEDKKVDNTFEEYEDDGDDEIWNNVYASTGSKNLRQNRIMAF